jgi:HlyD family secretion protein
MKRVIQNNQYDLDKAVVSVELQDVAKQQSVLTSPINGILVRADAATVGTTVGATTVFSVIDPTSLVFGMDVDEADIGKVAVGQPVKVNLDAFPDKTSQYPVDRIDFVSHTTTNGGNAFTVEVKLPASSVSQYRIGMNGNADIITAERDNVPTIPIASVVDGKYVYLKKPTGFEKRAVTIGLQNDVDAEVTNGLREGDLIAVQPDKVPQKQER